MNLLENNKNDFSFESIYNDYKDIIYNLCCRYLYNKDEAEDACHDIFIKIYKSIGSFKGESKISTWIYRLTINHCLNCLRRKKIIKFITFENFIEVEKHDNDILNDNFWGEYDKTEQSKLLHKAIEKLPEKQKTALILNKFEDLSYQEIAKVMDTTISSVESLIFRAKQNLSKQLLKYLKK